MKFLLIWIRSQGKVDIKVREQALKEMKETLVAEERFVQAEIAELKRKEAEAQAAAVAAAEELQAIKGPQQELLRALKRELRSP